MGRILVSANLTAAAAPKTHPMINPTSAEELRKSAKVSPTLVVVVSVMIVFFFVAGFASGYVRRWLWGQELQTEAETRHRELMRRRRLHLMNSTSSAPRGLDPDLIAAMPLVRLKDLQDQGPDVECPVCLALFDTSDTLKLLPHCAHAFHSDCINQWFRAHSTCPLCRVSMTSPPPSPPPPPLAAAAAPSHTSIRIPPDFDVDAVPQPEANPPSDVHAESCSDDGFHGPAAHFVPGIRGDTAAARAATLASSIRRSRSVDTDLIQHAYVLDSEGTQHHRNSVAADGVSLCSSCAGRSFPNLRQLGRV